MCHTLLAHVQIYESIENAKKKAAEIMGEE